MLITPAYNEEENIAILIKSVLKQTIKPIKWIIVNDGSTDNTKNIVEKYAKEHDFIECVSLDRSKVITYYSRRVDVVIEGFNYIESLNINYEYFGVVDADMELISEDYYSGLIDKFISNPKLGVTAGIYYYIVNGQKTKVLKDLSSTPGSIQFFRLECYKQIGGYVPLELGGDDSLCDIKARMLGWKTQSYPKFETIQHRTVGTGDRGIISAKFRQGLSDYNIGTDWLFMTFKCLRRSLLEKPYILSGLFRLIGFYWGKLSRKKLIITPEIIKFVKREQRHRLKKVFKP